MSVVGFHETWAWVMIVANGLAGIWALAAQRWERLHTTDSYRKALWRFTTIAQMTVFVQVIVGTYLVAARDIKVSQFHMLYGFSCPIAVAIVYSYREQIRPHIYLLYGFGGLFIMGLGLRAVQVGTRT